MDIAGCRLCGRAHFCAALRGDVDHVRQRFNRTPEVELRENMDCDCEREDCQSHTACRITGFCVEEHCYAENEFVDTIAVESAPVAVRPPSPEIGETLDIVSSLLCSEQSRVCLLEERRRMENKLRFTFNRLLREHKNRHPRTPPNLCEMAGALCHHTRNVRLCPPDFDEKLRREVALQCSRAITTLLRGLVASRAAFASPFRRHTLVVGLLYLMRSGLVAQNTFMLPRIPVLCALLPLESYLQPHFHIKCKCITEIENVIKMHLRSLSPGEIQRLGATSHVHGL